MTLLTTLVEASARTLVLASVAGLLLIALRVKRPAMRLRLWTMVLVAAVVMPALTLVAPAWPVPAPTPATWVDRHPPSRPSTPVEPPVTVAPIAGPRPAQVIVEPASSPAMRSVSAEPDGGLIRSLSWTAVAVACYLAGVIILLSRMLVGWRTASHLVGSATPISDRELIARLSTHAAAIGLARPPSALESPALFVPMTIGVVKPVVVLPPDWIHWDAATIDAVLVHELAHIARRDAFIQRLSLLYRAVCWINPFAWWLHRRLMELGEQASDEAVLEAGVDRAAYASALIGFFRAIDGEPGRADWNLAMASGASVERRVERILGWQPRSTRRTYVQVAFAFVLISVTVLAASAEPVPFRVEAPVAAPTSPPAPISVVASTRTAPAARTGAKTVQTPSASTTGSIQMVVLLFDLASTRESRELAVSEAERSIVTTQSRFNVGLDPGKVWRIGTVGTSIDIVQDFTGDPDKIGRALLQVISRRPISPDVATRVTNVVQACADVSRLPTSDAYLSDWRELQIKREIGTAGPTALDPAHRGLKYFLSADSMTPEQQRRIEDACRQPNLQYNTVTVPAVTGTRPQAGPTSYVPFYGRQTAIVFDVASLSGDDLGRAVGQATQLVVERVRSDHWFSIVATGATPETLQDFTSDIGLLRTALARVSSVSTAVDARATVTSARRLCDAMGRRFGDVLRFNQERTMLTVLRGGSPTILTLFSPDAFLFFFTTSVERGHLAARDLHDVAATCNASLVSFYVPDAPWISPVYAPAWRPAAPAGFRRIGNAVGVGVRVAPPQPGCPVTLTATKPDLDGGYASAVIKNDSQKAIRLVTIGAVIEPNDPSLKLPRIVYAPGPATLLQPGTSVEIATQLLEDLPLRLVGLQGSLANIGVVEVEFVDGSKWSYDLKTKGRFER